MRSERHRHTPRNLLGGEKAGDAYAGAVVDNWIAPALTAENPSPAPWTQEQLQSYLRNGFSVLHGVAAGPMSPVPHGLSALPESDGRAIATYFADVGPLGVHRCGGGAGAAALR